MTAKTDILSNLPFDELKNTEYMGIFKSLTAQIMNRLEQEGYKLEHISVVMHNIVESVRKGKIIPFQYGSLRKNAK